MTRTVSDLYGVRFIPDDEVELSADAIDAFRAKVAAYQEVEPMDPETFTAMTAMHTSRSGNISPRDGQHIPADADQLSRHTRALFESDGRPVFIEVDHTPIPSGTKTGRIQSGVPNPSATPRSEPPTFRRRSIPGQLLDITKTCGRIIRAYVKGIP